MIATRDTTRAKVGSATVEITYSAPRVRGRNVFSKGVLGDTIWRTGANAATHLRIDADLEIGGQRIPAGGYTLYTAIAPDNSSYALIINRQVGQWGTTYDAAKDLARVPLRSGPARPTETLRIVVEGGVLKLVWDTTELSVPIAAR